MATPSKLEQAFRDQVQSLEGAQREMVRAEFYRWQWNNNRIRDIEKKLERVELTAKERNDLINERHKLNTENVSLYSHINRALKDAPVHDVDEFEAWDKA